MYIPEDRTFRNQILYLPNLARDENPLRGLVFEDCRIEGPAVVYFTNCRFEQSSWDTPGDTLEPLFWIVDEGIRVGAIGMDHCEFDRCRLRNIGIAGTQDIIDMFRQNIAPQL